MPLAFPPSVDGWPAVCHKKALFGECWQPARIRDALQASLRQPGLAQGVEVSLVSGRASTRADLSGVAQGEARHHLELFSGGLFRLRMSAAQPQGGNEQAVNPGMVRTVLKGPSNPG